MDGKRNGGRELLRPPFVLSVYPPIRPASQSTIASGITNLTGSTAWPFTHTS